MNIIIGGALGRMGREVLITAEAIGIPVVCGVDVAYENQPYAIPVVKCYQQIAADGTMEGTVLIDFSRPEALPDLLDFCQAKRLPCVLCATGYSPDDVKDIETASGRIPILRSANMSLGVNVMERLAAMAAKALGNGYDIEIVEKHHRGKADSPSGTALMFFEAVKGSVDNCVKPVFGRYGKTEKHEKGDIGLHAVRGGTVTGDHEVGFYGEGEHLLLTHRAESRVLFARGALQAARFLEGKPSGLYSMRDVVDEMLA